MEVNGSDVCNNCVILIDKDRCWVLNLVFTLSSGSCVYPYSMYRLHAPLIFILHSSLGRQILLGLLQGIFKVIYLMHIYSTYT